MNTATDMLTAGELVQLRSAVTALVTDTQLGAVSATLYSRRAGSYLPATGAVAYSEVAYDVTIGISPLSERQVAQTAGAQRGDVMMLLAKSEIAVDPGVADRVVTSAGVIYSILDVERAGVDTHYRLTGRRA